MPKNLAKIDKSKPIKKSSSKENGLAKYQAATSKYVLRKREKKREEKRTYRRNKPPDLSKAYPYPFQKAAIFLGSRLKEALPRIFKQGKGRDAVLSRIGVKRCQPKVWDVMNHIGYCIVKSIAERTFPGTWVVRGDGVYAKPRVQGYHVENALSDCGIDLVFPVGCC